LLILTKSILLSFVKNKSLFERASYKKYLKLSFAELVFGIIIAIICSLTWKMGIRDWRLLMGVVLVVISIVLFAVLGDLFVSVVKRIANVKDSGTCLPGHGGILDRLDSMLSAVPIFALEMLLLTYFI
jgi:phosphatidate cytidylyltransferase